VGDEEVRRGEFHGKRSEASGFMPQPAFCLFTWHLSRPTSIEVGFFDSLKVVASDDESPYPDYLLAM
jgi:hypothetical protein